MTEDYGLGPGTIAYITSTVADGTATPDDARRLMAEFVRQANSGKVAPELTDYVRDRFAAHLAGATLDSAFGVARGPGQPPIDDYERASVALEVLAIRLAGKSREKALGEVADARKAAGLPIHGDTQVAEAWKTHRVMALWALHLLRQKRPWTQNESIRLRKIYKGVKGIISPAEKSTNIPP